MVECTCLQCGKAFSIQPSSIKQGGGKYCSRKCQGLAIKKKQVCKCEQCGKSFEAKLSTIKKGGGHFCSGACRGLSRRNRIERTCLYCGEPFTVINTFYIQGFGKYCSKKCHGKATRGENSPHWRGGSNNTYGNNWAHQRKLAYERDGATCQICHRKPRKGERRFSVHHIKRLRLFKGDFESANELSNLITLCPQCHHKAEHGKLAVPVRLL